MQRSGRGAAPDRLEPLLLIDMLIADCFVPLLPEPALADRYQLISEEGQVRAGGRVPSTPEDLQLLAQILAPSDRVALEVTGSCWEVARILEPHVDRVVVVSPDDTGITQARAKTDRLDARALARLLWAGELESVWMPDARCRVLRRRLARREQLVRARTRSKNETHAVLQRRLQGKPPCSDLFGVKGRQWLAGLELPLEERESVDAAMRHVEFLDAEIAGVERLIAQQALTWPEIRRLMTVPGVNLICAATWSGPRLTDTWMLAALGRERMVSIVPKTRPAYPEQFRREAIELLRAGRSPVPGDCESGGRERERGAAGQSAHAVPMQNAGTERPGGTDAPRHLRA